VWGRRSSRCSRTRSSRRWGAAAGDRSPAVGTRDRGSRLTARPRPHEGGFAYRHPIEVRFGDTDALGHINNAVYIAYFEAARAGYHARVTGHAFGHGPDASRTTFVIAEAHISYRAPAFFGEPIVCEARVAWVSRTSFGMEYRVMSEGGPIAPARLVADGGTTQVMFDLVRGRPTRMPQQLLDAVERFEGHPIERR
jgi:acyl-CoA thioester hydrolase